MSLPNQSRISFLGNVRHKTRPHILELSEVLANIKKGEWEDEITKIRSLGGSDPKKAKALKKELPAIMFSGEFSGSDEASFSKHSGIICFDFDNLGGG